VRWPEICIWLADTALKIMNYVGDANFNSFPVKFCYELYVMNTTRITIRAFGACTFILHSNFGANMI
jgi:hypothetical protein